MPARRHAAPDAFTASAATLGTINTDTLGASADVVSSCDTDGVDVGYVTSYDVAGDFSVDQAVVSSVNAACDGLDWEVVLYGTAGDPLDSASGTIATSGTFTANFTGVSVEDVENIAIAITG